MSRELEKQESCEDVLGFQQRLSNYQGTSGATAENMAFNLQLLSQGTDGLRILLSIFSNEVHHFTVFLGAHLLPMGSSYFKDWILSKDLSLEGLKIMVSTIRMKRVLSE